MSSPSSGSGIGEPLLAFPMHGYFKMMTEGYRTRDAHLLQWFARLLDGSRPLLVASRPEPFPRKSLSLLARRTEEPLPGTRDLSPQVLTIPDLRYPKKWWIESVRHFRVPDRIAGPTVIWNPTVGLSDGIMRSAERAGRLHVDLLDDWTLHAAFEDIWPDVERAYARLLGAADSVTANSEGTVALARRFGRSDAVLLPNGCDPDRFDPTSLASGRTVVGYLGKIGARLDERLIEATARACPEFDFWLAGPVLEKDFGSSLRDVPNVRMLGDVPYRDVPALLQRFDVGWVPHGVEVGQVGGDAIKIYEYRAAALPVLTTPIIGTRERPMDGVLVRDGGEHGAELQRMVGEGPRVPRRGGVLPIEMTWRYKASTILSLLEPPRGAAGD